MPDKQTGITLDQLRLARHDLETHLKASIAVSIERWYEATGDIQIKGINAIFENVSEAGEPKKYVFVGCYVDIDIGIGEI